jgi:hypothetical protein
MVPWHRRHRMDSEQSSSFPHTKRLRPTCSNLQTWEAADAPRDAPRHVPSLVQLEPVSIRFGLMIETATVISLSAPNNTIG